MPKATLLYLIKGTPTEKLQRSLHLLDKHFNQRWNYPVHIFFEEASAKEKQEITSWTSSTITWVHLKDFLQLPPYQNLTKTQVQRWCEGLDGGRPSYPGYRQMCRFFSYGLYSHPAMESFDYYWRFDDDSYLTEDITYDPFALMEARGAVYGYRAVEFENLRECLGLDILWKEVKAFAKGAKLPTRFLKKLVANWYGKYTGFNFYNNFEINKISFWRSHKLYKQFFNHLDQTLGFYRYRWGDANVRAMSVGLFIQPKELLHFSDIGYRHNDHYAVSGGERIFYKPQSG